MKKMIEDQTNLKIDKILQKANEKKKNIEIRDELKSFINSETFKKTLLEKEKRLKKIKSDKRAQDKEM